MDAAARLTPDPGSPRVIFEDGLGQRARRADASGAAVELLRLRPSFATVPSFEFALRERTGRLAGFRHPSFVRVRGVERSNALDPLLTLVSEAAPGVRLSVLLAGAEARRVPLDIYTALCLIRQLVPAVAMLHDSVRDVAHGTLAPERLFVTPQSRLLIAEPVLGSAIEQLQLPRERYWRELRVAVAPGPARPRLDPRTDVMQLGVVALALVLGRPLRDDEVPLRLRELVSSVWAVSPHGGFEPLPHGLRGWLSRTLQLDPQRAFASPGEARAELEAVLGDSELVSSPASLEAFLARYRAAGEALAPAVIRSVPPREPLAVEPVASAATAVPAALPRPSASAGSTGAPAVLVHPRRDDAAVARVSGPTWRRLAAVLALVAAVGLAAAATLVARSLWPGRGPLAAVGTLELSTRPSAVEAFVDGTRRGTTPLLVALDPGVHTVELRRLGQARRLQLTINAGMKVTQHVDLTASRQARTRRVQVRQR